MSLQSATQLVADSMDEILANFKDGAKITVLVRTPDKPNADFCLTSDDLDEVIAMVERRKRHSPPPSPPVTFESSPCTHFTRPPPSVGGGVPQYLNLVNGKVYEFISEEAGTIAFRREGREKLAYLGRVEFDRRFQLIPGARSRAPLTPNERLKAAMQSVRERDAERGYPPRSDSALRLAAREIMMRQDREAAPGPHVMGSEPRRPQPIDPRGMSINQINALILDLELELRRRDGTITPENPMSFFTSSVDNWGAAEWFDRLANAIRKQDEAAVAMHRASEKDKVYREADFDLYRMIAHSSAMRLVRDYEPQVRAALSAPEGSDNGN